MTEFPNPSRKKLLPSTQVKESTFKDILTAIGLRVSHYALEFTWANFANGQIFAQKWSIISQGEAEFTLVSLDLTVIYKMMMN